MSAKKTTTRKSERKTEEAAPSRGKKKRMAAPAVAAMEVPTGEMAEAPDQAAATAAVAAVPPPVEPEDTSLPEASFTTEAAAPTEAPAAPFSETDPAALESPVPQPAETQPQGPIADEPTAPARPPRRSKPRGEPKVPKMGALDAAAKVLSETGEPMTCKALIEAMAARGYWTSPGGKTPDATLYSAILKEITSQRGTTRFQKTGRGQFAWREDRV